LLEKCESIGHVDSLQPPYSLLDRRVDEEILPWCLKNKTGVVAYSPLQNGLLTGKFNISRLSSDDWRHKSPFFKEPELSKNLKFVNELKTIADKYGKSLIHLAIAWVLMHPAVTSAIVGARRAGQVDDMIGGDGWKLEPEDMETIEEIRKKTYSTE
jgi:aryl-alcohol dehydrogenase-like predicted oxidoreductase